MGREKEEIGLDVNMLGGTIKSDHVYTCDIKSKIQRKTLTYKHKKIKCDFFLAVFIFIQSVIYIMRRAHQIRLPSPASVYSYSDNA